MHYILLSLGQAMRRKIFVLGLMVLIALSGVFIFTEDASYAVTSSRDKLSQDEKIERAYEFREGTGLLEEVRQEKSANKAETFDPSDKANVKNAKASKEENPEPSLGEQVQKGINKVTGND